MRAILVSLIFSVALQNPAPPPAASVIQVNVAVAERHLRQRAAPEYPPIAIAARVEATVVVRALIGEDGRVAAVLPVRSVPLLDFAATEAVRQWRYIPFDVSGKPAPVQADVYVPFVLDSARVAPLMRAFSDADEECTTLLAENNIAAAEPPCLELMQLAGKLPDALVPYRAMAYHSVGKLLEARGRAADALDGFRAEARLRGSGGYDAWRAHRAAARVAVSTKDNAAAKDSFRRAESEVGKWRKTASQLYVTTPEQRQLRAIIAEEALVSHREVLAEYVAFLKSTSDKDLKKVQEQLDALVKSGGG